MSKYDFLIVGAGFFGSTFAERAKQRGKRVLVIDQRNHIGGNCYTENIDNICVHRYGPHIFNTNSKVVWDYVNCFSEFNHFVNRVKAFYKGRFYSFPINLLTLHQLWGVNTPKEAEDKMRSVKIPIKDPNNIEDWCLSNIGQELYETFIKGYTTKQWRKNPSELSASIVKRLPVRFNFDDNYYKTVYQGIPIHGYTPIFEKMLDGVELKLNTPLEKDWKRYANKLVYSGRPDALLNYKYGELPYLTLDFKMTKMSGDFQGNAQVNYTDESVPYTRCVEYKHFNYTGQSNTIVVHEYPTEWEKNKEPYYPIPGHEELYQKYKAEIANSDIILGGRLGKYQYRNMDQIIASALKEAERHLQ